MTSCSSEWSVAYQVRLACNRHPGTATMPVCNVHLLGRSSAGGYSGVAPERKVCPPTSLRTAATATGSVALRMLPTRRHWTHVQSYGNVNLRITAVAAAANMAPGPVQSDCGSKLCTLSNSTNSAFLFSASNKQTSFMYRPRHNVSLFPCSIHKP